MDITAATAGLPRDSVPNINEPCRISNAHGQAGAPGARSAWRRIASTNCRPRNAGGSRGVARVQARFVDDPAGAVTEGSARHRGLDGARIPDERFRSPGGRSHRRSRNRRSSLSQRTGHRVAALAEVGDDRGSCGKRWPVTVRCSPTCSKCHICPQGEAHDRRTQALDE